MENKWYIHQLPEGGTSDSLTSIDFTINEITTLIKTLENG